MNKGSKPDFRIVRFPLPPRYSTYLSMMGSIGVLLTFCLGSVIDWKYLALVSFTFSILMSLVCIEDLCNCNRVILRQRYLFCRNILSHGENSIPNPHFAFGI